MHMLAEAVIPTNSTCYTAGLRLADAPKQASWCNPQHSPSEQLLARLHTCGAVLQHGRMHHLNRCLLSQQGACADAAEARGTATYGILQLTQQPIMHRCTTLLAAA